MRPQRLVARSRLTRIITLRGPPIIQDDAAPVVVQPPDSPVDHVEFGYSVAYASGKFVVGARELGDDKIGAAFLYSL